jgi:hypothetical protein
MWGSTFEGVQKANSIHQARTKEEGYKKYPKTPTAITLKGMGLLAQIAQIA